MALSKALSHGTAKIDRWHWETHDVAWFHNHYYSVKPPGLVAATFPVYEALNAIGAPRVAHDARVRAESNGGPAWAARSLPIASYGFSVTLARTARDQITDDAPLTWVLTLFGVLLPALILLNLVRRFADRVAPGTGTASALTLGACTMILPFSTLYFSHLLSAALGFGAFALAWREREGPPRLALLALAGLIAGLAVVCEYPLGIAALIVGAYAVLRGDVAKRLPRAFSYGGGLAIGVAPLLAYHWWAFGSPLHMSYANAIATTGISGHDTLGLNDGGFFGITLPRPGDGLALLFGGRGLLALAPVLVMAIAGVVVMYREGPRRTEARTIAAIALAYLLYNAGYWLPFGGGSPGPRFLIPILPFLAIGFGPAWRRWPAPTLALAAISASTMVAATISYPMIGTDDPGEWIRRIDYGLIQHSVLDLAGLVHGLPALLPFVFAIGIAVALAVRTLGVKHLVVGAQLVPRVVAVWVLAAIFLPHPFGLPTPAAFILIAFAAVMAMLATALARLAARREPSAQHEQHHAAPPLTGEVQTAQRSV